MTSERRREGKLVLVTGASRSGKTLRTAQEVAGEPSLLVWDLLGEWSLRYRCKRISTIAELAAWVKGGGRGRVAFHCQRQTAMFPLFCRVAWAWIRLTPRGPLIVEETASVTQPGKAPPEWGDIIRMGLRYGHDIIAITQRPAESDKTAFGNASIFRCGRATTPRDRAAIAEYLDVPLREVAALKPLQFIERHASGELIRGTVNPKLRT